MKAKDTHATSGLSATSGLNATSGMNAQAGSLAPSEEDGVLGIVPHFFQARPAETVMCVDVVCGDVVCACTHTKMVGRQNIHTDTFTTWRTGYRPPPHLHTPSTSPGGPHMSAPPSPAPAHAIHQPGWSAHECQCVGPGGVQQPLHQLQAQPA